MKLTVNEIKAPLILTACMKKAFQNSKMMAIIFGKYLKCFHMIDSITDIVKHDVPVRKGICLNSHFIIYNAHAAGYVH